MFLRSIGIFYYTIFFLGVVFWELQGVEVSKGGRSAILGGHFFEFVRIWWVESKNGCPQPTKASKNNIGLIVSEKIGFLQKIRGNFSFGCHSERKNGVTKKIFTPLNCDGQIIFSAGFREQNGISSFSMLPMVWAEEPRKWNFSVLDAYFWDEIS